MLKTEGRTVSLKANVSHLEFIRFMHTTASSLACSTWLAVLDMAGKVSYKMKMGWKRRFAT